MAQQPIDEGVVPSLVGRGPGLAEAAFALKATHFEYPLLFLETAMKSSILGLILCAMTTSSMALARNLTDVKTEGFECFVCLMSAEGSYWVTKVASRTVGISNGHRDELVLSFKSEKALGEFLFTYLWLTSQGMPSKWKPSVTQPDGTESFYDFDCSKPE